MKKRFKFAAFLLAFMALTSCTDNITRMEYDGEWAMPIGKTRVQVDDMLINFLDSSLIEVDNETKLVSLSYVSDTTSLNFNEMQKQLLDFDTTFIYRRAKSFPDIPGIGFYDFYYRDTITFRISDFTGGMNLRVDEFVVVEGLVKCAIDIDLPEEWTWACNVSSENISLNSETFNLNLGEGEVAEDYSLENCVIAPTGGESIFFVCDFTLTVGGPCPADTLAIDIEMGLKDMLISSLSGDLCGFSYSFEGSQNIDLFESMPELDFKLFGSELDIQIGNGFGMAVSLVVDHFVASNGQGDVLQLIEPNSVFNINAPSMPGDVVNSTLAFNLEPDFFSLKPTRIDYSVSIVVADDGKTDFIDQESMFDFYIDANMPMNFQLDAYNIVDTISFGGLGLEENITGLDKCDIIVDLVNTIPFDLNAMLIFCDTNFSAIDTMFNGQLAIGAPACDDAHEVSSPFSSSYVWSVDAQQALEINDARFVLVDLMIQTPEDEEYVVVRTNSFLELMLKAKVKFSDFEFEDGE